MTDQPIPTPDTTNAPQKPRKRAQKRDSFSVTDMARARLRKRGVKSDERLTDECKVVRGILRANFDVVRKSDANVRKAKDARNDRKPWPTNMNATTAALVAERRHLRSNVHELTIKARSKDRAFFVRSHTNVRSFTVSAGNVRSYIVIFR
jgi:hypothetical protein